MGKINDIRRAKDKPKFGMTSPQSDSANESIYTYPENT